MCGFHSAPQKRLQWSGHASSKSTYHNGQRQLSKMACPFHVFLLTIWKYMASHTLLHNRISYITVTSIFPHLPLAVYEVQWGQENVLYDRLVSLHSRTGEEKAVTYFVIYAIFSSIPVLIVTFNFCQKVELFLSCEHCILPLIVYLIGLFQNWQCHLCMFPLDTVRKLA